MTLAIIQHKSWHSRLLKRLPAAPLNILVVNTNKSIKGCGPEARPPNVLSGSPAPLTLLVSHLGHSPAYRRDISCLNDLAQPIFESGTTIAVSESWNASATSGSLPTYCLSTLNPTPVPQSKIYISSSKARGWSIGRYEQLNPATLSLSSAGPAVIKQRIEGITSRAVMASLNIALSVWLTTPLSSQNWT